MGIEDCFGGNIDHLHATLYTEPATQEGVRKQFLMLYDTVPGGTGYLKELAREPKKVMEILDLARSRLMSCACQQDDTKDGCYRCLYAYRNSYEHEQTSRDHAVELIEKLLKKKDTLTQTDSLGDVRVTGTFDSHLEKMFVESLRRITRDPAPVDLTLEIFGGRQGWRLRWGGQGEDVDVLWEIHQQVDLGHSEGVMIKCRPDFVLVPVRTNDGVERLPIAVFTDGWVFHRDRITDDFAKRMAVIRSGRYVVWSLDYHDVYGMLHPKTRPPSPWCPSAWSSDQNIHRQFQGLCDKYGVQDARYLMRMHNHALLTDYLLSDHPMAHYERRALAMGQALLTQGPTKEGAAPVIARALPYLDPRMTAAYTSITQMLTAHVASKELHVVASQRPPNGAKTVDDLLSTLDLFELLDNAPAHVEEAAFRDVWKALLGAQNFLQFLPNAVFLASDGLDRVQDSLDWLVPRPLDEDDPQARAFAALDQDDQDAWEELMDEALEEELEILQLILIGGHPRPTLGYSPTDERGRPAWHRRYRVARETRRRVLRTRSR